MPTTRTTEKRRRTTEEWWADTKGDPRALIDWLYDQYRGERTAAGRIERLRDLFAAPGGRAHRVLSKIADQERRHADWVGGLLLARGLHPAVLPAKERYWAAALPGVRDLRTGAAVGAHAERMRLRRIEVIAADPAAPPDVRRVFRRILPQERFHERAFRSLAGDEAMRAAAAAHLRGEEVLGLIA